MNTTNNQIKIIDVQLISNEVIHLDLSSPWQQEDIYLLADKILSSLNHIKIIEKITGADRENYRFHDGHHNFILNFESYSQSCWIEPEDILAQAALTKLYQHLKLTLSKAC